MRPLWLLWLGLSPWPWPWAGRGCGAGEWSRAEQPGTRSNAPADRDPARGLGCRQVSAGGQGGICGVGDVLDPPSDFSSPPVLFSPPIFSLNANFSEQLYQFFYFFFFGGWWDDAYWLTEIKGVCLEGDPQIQLLVVPLGQGRACPVLPVRKDHVRQAWPSRDRGKMLLEPNERLMFPPLPKIGAISCPQGLWRVESSHPFGFCAPQPQRRAGEPPAQAQTGEKKSFPSIPCATIPCCGLSPRAGNIRDLQTPESTPRPIWGWLGCSIGVLRL